MHSNTQVTAPLGIDSHGSCKVPNSVFDLSSELFAKGKSLDRSRYAPLANELMAAGGRSQGKLTRR